MFIIFLLIFNYWSGTVCSVFRIWNLNLRTFVAKYWCGDLRTFWRKILKARFTRICRETFTPGFMHFSAIFFDWKGGSANFFAFRMYVYSKNRWRKDSIWIGEIQKLQYVASISEWTAALLEITACWHTCAGRRSRDGKKRDGALSEANLTCDFEISSILSTDWTVLLQSCNLSYLI